MRYFIAITLFLLHSLDVVFADALSNRCKNFDEITLQLALTPNNTEAPFTLDKIHELLGAESSSSSFIITSYSWVHKNLVLLVRVKGNDIITNILNGNSDGSVKSKKMESVYHNLKAATSVWSIQEIQQQLGPIHYQTNSKFHEYRWHCNNGFLTITTNEQNTITAAVINYKGPLKTIDLRIGPGRPGWDDIKVDQFVQNYFWQRSFVSTHS